MSAQDDAVFDCVYPTAIRAISRRFWTPVEVARRAASLFRQAGATKVLDVGAGVGKFVLVAAAAAPSIHFVGVERRRSLVQLARAARSRLGVANAAFKCGDAILTHWDLYDGFYFFNPFAENLFREDECIDRTVELAEWRFLRDILHVEKALRAARLGTAVVTYHGMGGRMPACYDLARIECAGSDRVELWVKTRPFDGGLFVAEDDEPS